METTAAPEVTAEAPEVAAKEVEAKEPKLTEGEEVKVAEKPIPKKYKLKVYDKEEEVDEDEVIRRAQRASAADEKFQKASELEKRYNATVENLKKNPWELFKALNMDPHAAAEQLLIEQMKFQQMSPKERRAWEIEQENEQLKSKLQMTEEERQNEKKAVEEQRFDSLKSDAVNTIDQGIVKAIQDAGLKKATPSLIRRVAQQMLSYHHTNGGVLQDPSAALKKVLNDMQGEWSEALEALPESEYDTRLPKGFVESLRKHLISRVDSPASFTKQKSDTTAKSGKRVKSSTDDFFELMDKRFG